MDALQGMEASDSEVEALREQVARLNEEREQWLQEKARLNEEREQWLEEKDRLTEENETLKRRCEKLARATPGEKAGDRLPPLVDKMLRSPKDESVQLQGIEALFAQQTQVDGVQGDASTPALQGSLEAAVAIFSNHPNNHTLLLKASQFLSILLREPNTQEQLPLAVLFQASQSVMAVSIQLLADIAPTSSPEGLAAFTKDGSLAPKMMRWFLALLALLLPCLGARVRIQVQGETFIHDLFSKLISRLLASAELPQEVIEYSVKLLPLLPKEPWIQKICLESGVVHNLALAYHRCMGGSVRGEVAETTLSKAIHMAIRFVFAENMEICVKALEDTFVSDEFICKQVLDELRGMEKKQRGAYRALDSEWGFTRKAVDLWTFHQRRALEDQDPQKSTSAGVLQKVAELLNAIILKLPPQVLLIRMQEFQDTEVVQRIALAAIHTNAQLRLQIAVNYVENKVIPVVIGCMQMFLRHYEGTAPNKSPTTTGIEAAFRLVRDAQLPADAWPYVLYCLEVCLHILSHWSATKLCLGQQADPLGSRAAPVLLAQGGLVDVLAELIDPVASGFELCTSPPTAVLQKANETLQALFEQNAHICIVCMQTYTEVQKMVALGCDSLSMDPLTDKPELQQQAVTQLVASFDKFSCTNDKLGWKIRKALAVLFESSYRLVAWFLKHHTLNMLGDYQSLDVHIEAVRALARAPYWSAEDAPLLPEFVGLIAELLLRSIEGHGDDPTAVTTQPKPSRRVFDLTEAQEVVAACMTSVLHLLLIDPSPPTVLHCLSRSLSQYGQAETWQSEDDRGGDVGSEQAVNTVMRVMQVFPSSDHVQLNCQHLLTSLLGE